MFVCREENKNFANPENIISKRDKWNVQIIQKLNTQLLIFHRFVDYYLKDNVQPNLLSLTLIKKQPLGFFFNNDSDSLKKKSHINIFKGMTIIFIGHEDF